MQYLEPENAAPGGPAEPVARPGLVKTQLAAETLRLYRGDWAAFERFCHERGSPSLPATAGIVCAFLALPGVGRAALARRLAAIDQRHRAFGLPPPGQEPGVRDTLKASRRATPRRVRPARPSPSQLEAMALSCGGDLAGRRDRALLLLAAAGLGRAALVGLQAETLRFAERSLQLGGSGPPMVIGRTMRTDVCPVRAVEEWLHVSATRYGPVFRKVDRWGNVEHAALGTDAVRRILARRSGTAKPRTAQKPA